MYKQGGLIIMYSLEEDELNLQMFLLFLLRVGERVFFCQREVGGGAGRVGRKFFKDILDLYNF